MLYIFTLWKGSFFNWDAENFSLKVLGILKVASQIVIPFWKFPHNNVRMFASSLLNWECSVQMSKELKTTFRFIQEIRCLIVSNLFHKDACQQFYHSKLILKLLKWVFVSGCRTMKTSVFVTYYSKNNSQHLKQLQVLS